MQISGVTSIGQKEASERALHVYWWILIWRMIMRQIQNSGKISEDVRSGAPLLPVKG
jgi:hypothetical protein